MNELQEYKLLNQETKAIFELLQYKNNISYVLAKCNNSKDLEREIRIYHNSIGIPNWDFEDDENEGIDWVCFNEIWEALK